MKSTGGQKPVCSMTSDSYVTVVCRHRYSPGAFCVHGSEGPKTRWREGDQHKALSEECIGNRLLFSYTEVSGLCLF